MHWQRAAVGVMDIRTVLVPAIMQMKMGMAYVTAADRVRLTVPGDTIRMRMETVYVTIMLRVPAITEGRQERAETAEDVTDSGWRRHAE